MRKDHRWITLQGQVAPEVYEVCDILQHQRLLALEGKVTDFATLAKSVGLYIARRNTTGLNSALRGRKIEVTSTPERVEELCRLLIEAAEQAGLGDMIKHALQTGHVEHIGPIFLQLLQRELEKRGWTRDQFILD